MTKGTPAKELSTKEIIDFLKSLYSFYLKKKKNILIYGICGALLGLAAHFIYKPKYTANLSFALQEMDAGNSGIASIASQFGIALGGGSNGAFSGDNIFELFYSRHIIENVLLKPITIDNKKDVLINLYLKTYGKDKQIKESSKPEVSCIAFAPNQKREAFSRQKDSIIKVVYDGIVKGQLVAQKRSKKLSIGDISFVSENELLSKLFVEGLIQETSLFYIDTKTKLSRTNYDLLKRQTDSVKREYDRALLSKATLADNNLNAVRQTGSVGIFKKQTDIQVSMNAYIEMKKNLEMLKYSLAKETPIIQVIDKPTFPLEKKKIGILKGVVVGGFLGGIIALAYLLIVFYNSTIANKKE